MEIEGERTVPADRDLVWAALTDAQVLAACIPGCERVTAIGTNAWDIIANLTRGSVQSRFRGRLLTTEVNAPVEGIFVFDGGGGTAGALRGTARITLETLSPYDTRLVYAMELHLGGRLLSADVAQVTAVVAGFFQHLIDALGGTAAPAPFLAGTAQVRTRSRLLGAPTRVLSGMQRWFKRRRKTKS